VDYRRWNVALAVAAAEVAANGAAVWVQTPALELVPGALRRLRPDLRIGVHVRSTSLAAEAPCGSPIYRDIVVGLLGADLVGFQTSQSAARFMQARDVLRSNGNPEGAATPEVGVFPTSVEAAGVRWLAADADLQQRARRLREEAGGSRTVLLVDGSPGVRSGGGSFEVPGWLAALRATRDVGVLRWEHDATLAERVAAYLAADVLVANQVVDSSDLAALEFAAAARPAGALVVGRKSAAAAMLPQAFVVDGPDMRHVTAVVCEALSLDADERAARMAAMRRYVEGYDTHAWARSFMIALQPNAVPDWMVHKDPASSDWTLNERVVAPRSRSWPAGRLGS
jgi:trehalose 6-phosphate synthase